MMEYLFGKKDASGNPPLDLLQRSIGAFGKYQCWLCFIVFLSKFPIAWHQMAIIFLSPKVSFTCDGVLNACPCANPVYDRSIFSRTMVMEWHLICERQWLASFAQMIFQAGTLIGSIIFGMASDRMGRRTPFIVSVIMELVAGIGAAYAKSFWLFNVLRFVVGIAVGGNMVIGFVVIMEFVGAKYRATLSALYQVPFNIGHLILPLFGYLFRDYSDFQLSITIPVVVLLSYVCVLPETARWLLAMKRTEDAIKISEKVAKWNNLPVDSVRPNLTKYQAEISKHNLKKGAVWDLFKTPNLRRNILVMAYGWLACSYCFYGISQYISHLTGDIFVNVSLSAAVTLCGTLASVPLMKVMGRKTMMMIFNFVCSMCLFILAFIPEGTACIICACFGDMSAFIVFILVYLYTTELFPTVVRSAAMGVSSMSARIGSMIAPYVIDLKQYHTWAPPVVFGIVPAISVIVTSFLPETKDCELTNTLEEGENFKGRQNPTPK